MVRLLAAKQVYALKPRCYSRTGTGGAGAIVLGGTANGTIPIGRSLWLKYRRNANGTQTFLVNGVEIPMTLVNGTPPTS
jgi:hypothetical protein